ncbi:type II toxin-antitoxin system antitoxin DNA ADP-ribosyl glycohydrolase DarG [Mycobacterium colombiense]
MITYGSGDLLAANTEALVNTVNCAGVMGKGIALQFKRRYPEMYKAYEKACNRGEVTIGKMFVFETGQLDGPRYIINFPTKKHWRAPSQLSYIDAGLADLVQVLRELKIGSVAIPPLGAGNGGLDWADVEPRLVSAFEELCDIHAVIYPPSGGTRAIEGVKAIRMTWGKAVILEAVRRYLQQRRALEPWEDPAGVSHLEIQKLMYFANDAEPSLALDFTPGRYGPYSELVRHQLQGMEGTFTVGLGDGTAKVLANEPISLTRDGIDALADYLATESTARRVSLIVDTVLRIIEGFEGPYGVELLASTHWVAKREGATEPAAAATAVRKWTKRKGRIYNDDRVSVALERILQTA